MVQEGAMAMAVGKNKDKLFIEARIPSDVEALSGGQGAGPIAKRSGLKVAGQDLRRQEWEWGAVGSEARRRCEPAPGR